MRLAHDRGEIESKSEFDLYLSSVNGCQERPLDGKLIKESPCRVDEIVGDDLYARGHERKKER